MTVHAREPAPAESQPREPQPEAPLWVSLVSVGVWAVLIVTAIVVGRRLLAAGEPVLAEAPPLFATWSPHWSTATWWALGLAVLVIALSPVAVRRLRWGVLLAAGYVVTVAWTVALAMVSGLAEGITERLTKNAEYLEDIENAPPLVDLLPEFSDRIIGGQADSWVSHVAGHPPGALGFYLVLDALGLEGGAWAAAATILVGGTAVVAVAVALRAISSEATARRALPFLVLAPGVVWAGVSADAVFAAVAAWGVALLAVSFSGTSTRAVAATAGAALLALGCYMSYGLVLMAPVALAVVAVRWDGRTVRRLLWAGAGFVAVVALFTIGGFSWWEGLTLVRERYLAGYGGVRPYGYWVWANLAAAAIMLGPAVAAGLGQSLRRGVLVVRHRAATRSEAGLLALVGGATAAVLAATLSGMSKAEVERIWLPFAGWLTAACALLPWRQMRWWLAAQAATALAIEHLLLIRW